MNLYLETLTNLWQSYADGNHWLRWAIVTNDNNLTLAHQIAMRRIRLALLRNYF